MRNNKQKVRLMNRLIANPCLPARQFACAVVILLALSTGTLARAADPAAPTTVEQFHETLLKIMRNADSLGFSGRYDTLKPVVEDNFDTPLIAKVILGRHWESLNDDQKQQFIDIFNELSIATYASRFSSYDGEDFEYLGTESLNKQRVLVRTRMTKPDDDDVKFDYLMHQRDGKWYIMSIVAQGVNDLSMKRAEYTAIMESRGFDGLVAELHGKIAALKPANNNNG